MAKRKRVSKGSGTSACQQELPTKKARQETQDIWSFNQASTSFFGAFPRRERSKRRIKAKNSISKQNGKLDTNVFECYLEKLWMNFDKDKRTSCTYLDCLWFASYKNGNHRAKVLMWIKRKEIFSKNYVFVPIVCWSHWSLLIFCHFGGNLQSKDRTPCMLLLDSLALTNPKRLEPDIRRFVLDIYKAEGRSESKELIYKIPLLVPKVPQQRNGEECGIFVLYFINLFVESAPENFSISKGHSSFMKENWFCSEGFESFCKKIQAFGS